MRSMCAGLAALAVAPAYAAPPHIVFIIADDLGFNDISLHGSPQIPTPNIDALAADGVTLMNYHGQPVCSPSRGSILSGRHAIHTGIYMPFSQGTALRLNTSFTLLPSYLKAAANYSTHLVGKWHLGQNTMSSLPTSRGFDTHVGYWSGAEDHVTHVTTGAWDFNDNLRIATEYNNTFSTPIFAQRAIDIINQWGPGGAGAASGQPLFLYLAWQDVHWPLQAPQAYLDRFANATGGNAERQAVCAMAAHMDDGLGNVTAALKANGLYDDTVMVFVSDNGGPEHNNEGTWSSNYPLRGGKNTLWEGGTRVIGIVRGAGIQQKGVKSYEKIHITDWLPTLMRAAGFNWTDFIPANEPPYQYGDGMDVWQTLATGAPSPRDWLLLETHEPNAADQCHGDALIVGDWKIIKTGPTNPPEEDGWFPPPGQDPASVNYEIKCGKIPAAQPNKNECADQYCLFNVTADPCEVHNLADQHPEVVKQLKARLQPFQATSVPPTQPVGCDPVKVKLPNGALAWQPCDAPPAMAPPLSAWQ